MSLNPRHLTVKLLLQGRLFRIPDYQRAYSWETRQRAELFSDIKEAYTSQQDHFMATIVGLSNSKRTIGADEFQEVDLVDGQQRLTTIVILLKSVENILDDQDDEEAKLKRDIKELLVKHDRQALLLLQTNHNQSFYSSYIREGELPTTKISTKAEQNLINAVKECTDFVNDWRNAGLKPIDLLATIYNRLSMIYHEISDEATVYRVFEVLNSRGISVQWIDKLKSQLMALLFQCLGDGSREEAIAEMKGIWQTIYGILGLDMSWGDEAVRFTAAWLQSERPSKIPGVEEAYTALVKNAGNDYSGVIKIGQELKRVIEILATIRTDNRLRGVSGVAHARFVATSIYKSPNISKVKKDDLLRTWEKVTFKIFGLAGADSRYSVGDYVRLGYDIINNSNTSEADIQKRLLNIGEDRDYDMDSLIANKHNWEDCYNNWQEELRYLFFRYDEYLAGRRGVNVDNWNKIWEMSPTKSIEHILPQSSGKNYVHRLGNLAFLPPGVNSSLRDKPPEEKAKTYIEMGTLATQQLGREILKNTGKWDRDAIMTREMKLLDFIKKEWS